MGIIPLCFSVTSLQYFPYLVHMQPNWPTWRKSHTVKKAESIYLRKIAPGLIQMLPIWDNTLVLTCMLMSSYISTLEGQGSHLVWSISGSDLWHVSQTSSNIQMAHFNRITPIFNVRLKSSVIIKKRHI